MHSRKLALKKKQKKCKIVFGFSQISKIHFWNGKVEDTNHVSIESLFRADKYFYNATWSKLSCTKAFDIFENV